MRGQRENSALCSQTGLMPSAWGTQYNQGWRAVPGLQASSFLCPGSPCPLHLRANRWSSLWLWSWGQKIAVHRYLESCAVKRKKNFVPYNWWRSRGNYVGSTHDKDFKSSSSLKKYYIIYNMWCVTSVSVCICVYVTASEGKSSLSRWYSRTERGPSVWDAEKEPLH